MDTPTHKPLPAVHRPRSVSHLYSLDIIKYKNLGVLRKLDDLHAESREISRIESAHCRRSSGRAIAIAVKPSSLCRGIGSAT